MQAATETAAAQAAAVAGRVKSHMRRAVIARWGSLLSPVKLPDSAGTRCCIVPLTDRPSGQPTEVNNSDS